MKVPDYQRQTGLTDLPAVRQDINARDYHFLGATQAAFAESADSLMQQVNQGMAQFHAQQVQAADNSRVQDARNHTQNTINALLYGENGVLFKQGAEAFQPEANGKPVAANVLDGLDRHIGDVSDALGNDEQRRQYLEWANAAKVQAGALLEQHEGQQFRVYRRGVGLAAIDTQQQTMGLNYNNPSLLESGIAAINRASVDLAGLEGYPEQYGLAEGRKQASAALSGAVRAALAQNDSAAAGAILKQFSAHMQTEDLLRNEQLLGKVADSKVSQGIADQVMAKMTPRLATSDYDRLRNITFAAESGGRQVADTGRLPELTGPEAAALAGLPWNPALFNRAAGGAGKDREAEQYHQALADAYLKQQLADFHGDLGQAWAAYQAGPQAARAALQQAGQQGGNWLSYLPKATQAYVKANLREFRSGGGEFKRPTLADAQEQALSQLGEDSSPALRKQVLNEVSGRFRLQSQALRQQQEQGRAEAMRALLQNGGRLSELPVQVLAGLSLKDTGRMQDFAEAISSGKPVRTDWELYYKLKSDPALLKKTDLMAFRDRLHDSEYRQLADEQQAGTGGQATETRSAKEVLNQFMAEAGIDPNPKYTDKAGVRAVGRIWSAFEQRLNAAEKLGGKRLNGEEMHKLAAQLFTRVGVKGLLFGSEEKPAVLVDWKKDRVVIPDADRARIVQALGAARPGAAISEDDIFYLYLKHKGLL